MTTVQPEPGFAEPVNEPGRIPTPAMVVDVAKVEANLRAMADYTRQHGLALRPHTKTHKLRRFGRRQMELGAAGLTVAKVGEAVVMAAATDDLLIAYPALDRHRTCRIADLARQLTVRVAVDSSAACEALGAAAVAAGSTIGILVDLDVGFHRTGVQSAEASASLAQQVARSRGLRLDGLFSFPGHVMGTADEQRRQLASVDAVLHAAIERWRAHGLEPAVVSGGSTPSAYHSHHVSALTEMRPGTYIYQDVNGMADGVCSEAQCAATVWTTVVSNAVPGKVVVDAGSKSLTRERHTRCLAYEGHGHVMELPGAKVVRLSEEHGEIDIAHCDREPKLGDRLRIVPAHVCPSVNLHDRIWLAHPDGRYEPVAVDARGMVC